MKTRLTLTKSNKKGYGYSSNSAARNTAQISNIEYKLNLILNKLERLFKQHNR